MSTLDIVPTLLAVAECDPIPDLPGRSLLPLLGSGAPPWRTHLFTEYHLHSAHNFYPQRTVRNGRYKLIRNLLPREPNPGHQFTLKRFFAKLHNTIESAPKAVREAYARMEIPPSLNSMISSPTPSSFITSPTTRNMPLLSPNFVTSCPHGELIRTTRYSIAKTC